MNSLWYVLIWYAIGLLGMLLLDYLNYRAGEDFTLKKVGEDLLLSVFGPIITFFIFLVLLSVFLSNIDENTVLIKGKKK